MECGGKDSWIMVVMPVKAFDHIPFLTEKGPATWGLLAFHWNVFRRSNKTLHRRSC
jgi:hypothetical protein